MRTSRDQIAAYHNIRGSKISQYLCLSHNHLLYAEFTMEQLPALNWIIGFLESSNIPYVVCGGLAAKVYGADKELNDIDIYVPDKNFNSVVNYGAPYITFGPTHHKGEQWEPTYVKFEYLGQDVEVGSDKECKILDNHQSKWITQKIDFKCYERRKAYGVDIKVMKKDELVAYKKQLNRKVDIKDINQINENV